MATRLLLRQRTQPYGGRGVYMYIYILHSDSSSSFRLFSRYHKFISSRCTVFLFYRIFTVTSIVPLDFFKLLLSVIWSRLNVDYSIFLFICSFSYPDKLHILSSSAILFYLFISETKLNIGILFFQVWNNQYIYIYIYIYIYQVGITL